MKKLFCIASVLLLMLSLSVHAQGKKKGGKETVQFTTKADTISYILGADIGKNIRESKIDFSELGFMKGLVMGYNKQDTLLSKEDVERIMQQFQVEMEARQEADKKLLAAESKSKGEAYVNLYRSAPGVLETSDGLLYKVLKEGEGASPRPTDTVTVYYKGKLIDGTVFDETKEGEPVSFPLSNLIRGWTLGIQKMKVGGKYEFVIPPALGYGDREVGPIPAGSTLVFEVELLGIKPGGE